MTLKRELDDPRSPVRLFFDAHLPGNKAPRAFYAAQLKDAKLLGSPALLALRQTPTPHVPPHPYDIVGHSVGIALSLLFTVDPDRHVRSWSRHPTERTPWPALDAFWTTWRAEVPSLHADLRTGSSTPAARARLIQLCTVAGLLDQLYRVGTMYDLPVLSLPPDATPTAFLGLALPKVTDDALVMFEAAVTALSSLTTQPAVADPALSGASLVGAADADLLVGSTLLEVKAILDRKISLRYMQQLVAYALLDLDDRHGMTHVAFYNARYGRLVTWDLPSLLTSMAGRTMTTPEARELLCSSLG
jgi:hypothetical protein